MKRKLACSGIRSLLACGRTRGHRTCGGSGSSPWNRSDRTRYLRRSRSIVIIPTPSPLVLAPPAVRRVDNEDHREQDDDEQQRAVHCSILVEDASHAASISVVGAR